MGVASFFTYILKPDISWIVVGLKGTGKTNFAVVLMQEAIERGYHVYTNIHFFDIDQVPLAISRNKLPKRHDSKPYRKKPAEIHVCSTLSELLIGLCEPQRKVVILDEAGIHADSSNPMSTSTRNIKNISKIIRHFDASFGLITQTANMIPPDLRERTLDVEITIERNGYERILSAGKRSTTYEDDGTQAIYFPTVDRFGPVPMAIYPYDGKFPSGFDINIDMKAVLDALSNEPNTMSIIDEGKGKKIIENLAKTSRKRRKR